jgi:hypothetical protein
MFRLPLRLCSATRTHLCPSSRKQADLVRQNTSCHRITLIDFQSFHVISCHVTSHVKEAESIFVLVLRCLWIISWHFEWWGWISREVYGRKLIFLFINLLQRTIEISISTIDIGIVYIRQSLCFFVTGAIFAPFSIHFQIRLCFYKPQKLRLQCSLLIKMHCAKVTKLPNES